MAGRRKAFAKWGRARVGFWIVAVVIVVYYFLVGIFALLAQMIVPARFAITDAFGFGSALVPLVVIVASLELGDERAPLLAGLLGLLIDLDSGKHFGVSMLVLASLSALITTQAQSPVTHWWLFRLTCVLIGTYGFFTIDYLFTLLETSRWIWPLAVWSKISLAAFLNLLLCPLVFLVLGTLPRRIGWIAVPEPRDRRYDRR